MLASPHDTPTPGGDYENTIEPPNEVIYHSASYETTPLLSFTSTNEREPSLLNIHSSGRNYNNTSNKYNTSGKYTGSGRYQDGKHPSIKSYQTLSPTGLYAVLAIAVLQSIGFTLVMPSMYLYLKQLGGATAFFGWIVAIYSVGSFIGAIVFGRWSDYRNAKESIMIATFISIAGNCLYCIIQFIVQKDGHWIMFTARFVVGFGSGCVAVCRAYLAENTDMKNKVKMMAAVSGAQGIGFVIGPGLGSALAFVNFKIYKVEVNQYTSPGYLSAIFCAICFLIAVFLMPAISRQKQEEAKKRASLQQLNEKKLPIYVSLFVFFAIVSVFAIFETDFTILSKRDFQWGTFANSIYFLASAVISTIVYFIIGIFPKMKTLDDRKATAFGLVLLIIGMLFFVVYDKPFYLETKLTVLQIALGGVLFSIGYPFASTYIFARYSKILNPAIQGEKMGWITATGSLARIIGPVWASNGLAESDALVFGGTAVFLLIALVVLFIAFKILVPHKDYGKDVSTTSSKDNSVNP